MKPIVHIIIDDPRSEEETSPHVTDSQFSHRLLCVTSFVEADTKCTIPSPMIIIIILPVSNISAQTAP